MKKEGQNVTPAQEQPGTSKVGEQTEEPPAGLASSMPQVAEEEATSTISATKLAAVLKFQLGSSQYATMAMRELSKGGIQAYKAEYMGGR